MKKGWQIKTLGEVCQLISGQHIDAKDYNIESRGVGYLTGPSDFGPLHPVITKWTEHPKVKAKRGDVLITVKGSGVGKINLLQKDEVAISRQLMAVRVTGAEPNFVHAILSSTFDHFQSLSTGAAIPGISREQVLGLVIALPPLAEQQRIVGLLDEAFEGLAIAKANAEKNLQNAHALFESHHDSIFRHRREGWAEKPLGEVCEYVNGKAHEQCIDEDGRFIVINSKFISTNGEVFKKSMDALLLLQPGEIAMVLSDVPNGKALAKCFLVEEADTYTLNQRICLIRSTKFHTKFLFYQLNRNRHFLSFDNGGNQTNMRLNQVLSCPLFLPALAEQETIADTLDALSEETQRLARIYERKLAALAELKKSLLHQAFTGEL